MGVISSYYKADIWFYINLAKLRRARVHCLNLLDEYKEKVLRALVNCH